MCIHPTLATAGSSEDADALLQVLSANSSTYNAVALFNLLPGGAWSKEWLVNLGYDRTGLQVATGDNYTMRFGKTNNRVCCCGVWWWQPGCSNCTMSLCACFVFSSRIQM